MPKHNLQLQQGNKLAAVVELCIETLPVKLDCAEAIPTRPLSIVITNVHLFAATSEDAIAMRPLVKATHATRPPFREHHPTDTSAASNPYTRSTYDNKALDKASAENTYRQTMRNRKQTAATTIAAATTTPTR